MNPTGQPLTGRDMRIDRLNRGISRRALARKIDVHRDSIRKIENGEPVSLETAKKIADWYGVKVLDIMPGALDEAAA